jgi:hypothetical protein
MKKYVKLFLSIVVALAVPTFFGARGQSVEMGVIIIPSLLCAILINVDELKKSIVSIKAKDMEIKFKDAIDKAYATIEQLKDIQYRLTKVTTEILYRQKFWGGGGVENTYNIIEDLYQAALRIKAQEIIDEPLKVAYQRLISESFGHLADKIKDQEDKKKAEDAFDRIYDFKGNTNIIYDGKFVPTKNAINQFIIKLNLKKESLEDMSEAINLYGKILLNYQQIYGNIDVVDEITLSVGSMQNET